MKKFKSIISKSNGKKKNPFRKFSQQIRRRRKLGSKILMMMKKKIYTFKKEMNCNTKSLKLTML